MPRPASRLAEGWWDYTTLDADILNDAARLSACDLEQLTRPGFRVRIYDTPQEFYAAQALEYIDAWRQSSPDNPAGICGPIGPTEQLPIVAQMVNSLGLDLKNCEAHFWGMDEWMENDQPVSPFHPLSFARCDDQLCFDRIYPDLAMAPILTSIFLRAILPPIVRSSTPFVASSCKAVRVKSNIGRLTIRCLAAC